MDCNNNSQNSFSIDDNEPIDIPLLWAEYACAAGKRDKNANEMVPLYYKLKTLTDVDKQFLSENQKENWEHSFKSAGSDLLTCKTIFDDEVSGTYGKLIDDLAEWAYPLNRYQVKLKAIAWAKAKIKTGWSLGWAERLKLLVQPGETVMVPTTNDEIRECRLGILKAKKMKAYIKLENARKAAPEILPNFTPYISTLRAILKTPSAFDVHDDKARTQSKTIAAYINVLTQIDMEWFSEEQRGYFNKMLQENDEEVWGTQKTSRLYCRWQLGAIKWAQQKIKDDICPDLFWAKTVLPELGFGKKQGNNTSSAVTNSKIEIPCPSKTDLKKRRLEILALLKEDTEALLHDYVRRQALVPKSSERGSDSDCVII